MNFTEFEKRINQLVESRETADPVELREQAGDCSECRALCEQYLLLERVIPLWNQQTPSVDLADAVLARLQNEPPLSGDASVVGAIQADHRNVRPQQSAKDISLVIDEHATSTVPVRRQPAAVLAVVVLVLFLLVSALRTPPPTDSSVPDGFPISTNDPPAPDINGNQDSDDPELRILIQDASVAYSSLAAEATKAVADAKILVSDRYVASVFPPKAAPIERAEWIDKLEEKIEPLGKKFEQAVDFLRDVAPPEQAPTT